MKISGLTTALAETLAIFTQHDEPLTTPEVAEQLDLGRRATYSRLERLAEDEYLETKKVGASARVWWETNKYCSQPNSVTNETEFFNSDEDEIHNWNHQLSKLVETTEEYAIFFAFDLGGKFLRWNNRFEDVTGYTAEEIETSEPMDFIADRASKQTESAFNNVLEDGETVTIELPLVTRTGDEIPYEFTGTPVTDADDEIVGVTGIGRDISDRDARKRRVKRHRETLEADIDEMFNRIDEAFFAIDDEWRIIYINDQASALLDRDVTETHQSRLWDVFPDLSNECARKTIEEAVQSQESAEFEFKFDTLDFWAEIRVYPSESGLSVYLRDITDRKSREAELNRSFDLLHKAKEMADVGGWEMDPETRELYWTEQLFDITAVEQDEEPSLEHRLESYHDTDREVLENAVDQALEDGEAIDAEARFYTSDGELRWVHIQGEPELEDEEVVSLHGAVQDITDRKKREQELAVRARQQAVVAQLGKEALGNRNLDSLMAHSSEMVADVLDNEYCKVLDLDTEAEELLLRQGVGWDDGIVGQVTVSSVEDDSQAAYTLGAKEPVIVENLETETRFSGPELLTNHGVKSGISVIIGPLDDPWGILETHDTEQKSFTQEDVSFVLSVANILASAIERHHDEQQLRRQREELATLNNLNTIVHGISETVIGKSTREQIEQSTCNELAASASYEFAGIAGIDSQNERLEPRAIAGENAYVEKLLQSTVADNSGRNNPGMTALRTHETQVIQDGFSDSRFDSCLDIATEYDSASLAFIPIIHEGTVYGVLVLYTDRDNAFDTVEDTVISRLGEVIGHAIASIERKRALMSKEVVELTFKVSNVFEELEIPAEPQGSISVTEMVPLENEEFLIYGVATDDARESMKALEQSLPKWETVTLYDDEGDTRFEIKLSDHPVFSSLASLGGSLEEAVLKDGDYRLTIHVAPNVEVRNLIDCIKETYPGVEMVIRHQTTRNDEKHTIHSNAIIESLTERQRATLIAAYYSGYFEWPRDSTGEDVADSLGIAPPTFHNHLRKAQQTVIESIVTSE